MLIGRFREYDRPYLSAYISLSHPDWEGTVNFLVDTGADESVLSPRDAREIGVSFETLGNPNLSVGGLCGTAGAFKLPAELSFRDGERIVSYQMPLKIIENKRGHQKTTVAARARSSPKMENGHGFICRQA